MNPLRFPQLRIEGDRAFYEFPKDMMAEYVADINRKIMEEKEQMLLKHLPVEALEKLRDSISEELVTRKCGDQKLKDQKWEAILAGKSVDTVKEKKWIPRDELRFYGCRTCQTFVAHHGVTEMECDDCGEIMTNETMSTDPETDPTVFHRIVALDEAGLGIEEDRGKKIRFRRVKKLDE